MSAAAIKQLIKSTKISLSRNKKLRDFINLKTHSLYISVDSVYNAFLDELEFVNSKKKANIPGWHKLTDSEKEEFSKVIEQQSRYVVAQALKGARRDKKRIDSIPQGRRKYKSFCTIETFPGSEFIITLYLNKKDTIPFKKWDGTDVAGSVFTSLRSFYNKAASKAGDVIKQELGYSINSNIKPRVNLGHFEEDAVSRQREERLTDFFRKKAKEVKPKNLSQSQWNKVLKESGLGIFLDYKSTKDRTVIRTQVSGAKVNKSLGATTEKAILAEMRKALATKDIVDVSGSDSRIQIEKKKVLKTLEKKLKKSKHLKVTLENTKIKTSKHREKDELLASGRKNAPIVASGIGNIEPPKFSRQVGENSTVALAALINAKLSGTVKKNMGFPALENRTGRFASSVRVTDVTQTPKGFPSIGYTYQRSPYQIFEQGAGKAPWASKDRDPRQIIDKSIREIAVNLLTTRFYTRRV